MSARPTTGLLGRPELRTLAIRLVVAAAIAAVVYLIVRAGNLAKVPFLILLGLAVVVIGAKVVLDVVRPPKQLAHLARDSGEIAFGAPDRPYARARHWEERLDLVRGDAEHFNTVVLPEFAALADERLQVGHGITRESDPAAARALLGSRLSDFLDRTDRSKPPSRAELTAVIDDLEAL